MSLTMLDFLAASVQHFTKLEAWSTCSYRLLRTSVAQMSKQSAKLKRQSERQMLTARMLLISKQRLTERHRLKGKLRLTKRQLLTELLLKRLNKRLRQRLRLSSRQLSRSSRLSKRPRQRLRLSSRKLQQRLKRNAKKLSSEWLTRELLSHNSILALIWASLLFCSLDKDDQRQRVLHFAVKGL